MLVTLHASQNAWEELGQEVRLRAEIAASDNPSSTHTPNSLAHAILLRILYISSCVSGTLSMGDKPFASLLWEIEGNHHCHNSSCDAIIVPADRAPHLSTSLWKVHVMDRACVLRNFAIWA